jgi:DUF971 family protein
MEPLFRPENIQTVDRTLAVKWNDGREDYYDSELLRAISPSADNLGEADFFGNVHGGDPRTSYPGARIVKWERIGDYAIRFFFNDGHSAGYFTYKYLRLIADKERLGFEFPFKKDVRFCSHDHTHDESD